MNIEQELGVPFPGTVVPQAQWTQTGLKSLPTTGHLDWYALFGRAAPRVLDLGCGNGRSTIASAVQHPEQDHFGLDTLPVVIRYAVRRANQRGLQNVRFAVAEARDFLQRLVPPQSVTAIHLFHPQPYYDMAYVHRRLVTPEFMTLVHRALQPGGRFLVQTDNPGYWRYLQEIVPLFFDFAPRTTPWPEAPEGRTRREILARQRDLPIYRGEGVVRQDLDLPAVRKLAADLPPPLFNADRRLQGLDRLEAKEN
jgi:tRNA (guanine-N7-)-methyltransferase